MRIFLIFGAKKKDKELATQPSSFRDMRDFMVLGNW